MKDSNKLTKRILWAMIIGVVLGIALHNFVETPFVDKYLVGFVFCRFVKHIGQQTQKEKANQGVS